MTLTSLIEKEVELIRHVKTLKRDIMSRADFSVESAYRSIDRYNVRTIDSVSLSAFLRNNGFNPNELELLAIIRRLDTEGNATISL
jgi:Ca2+-binding EF-hand superfamily protein